MTTRAIAYLVLTVGSVAWLVPLVLQRRKSVRAVRVNRRARWGVLLVAVGYGLAWYAVLQAPPSEPWRIGLSAACFAPAIGFSWAGATALGRHWRVEAGLDRDHELVQSGVYSMVRHPIYTSMFFVVVATCMMAGPPYVLPVAALFYIAGTEIRVRAEEALLAERFGEAFQAYRRRVPAYLPLQRARRARRPTRSVQGPQ